MDYSCASVHCVIYVFRPVILPVALSIDISYLRELYNSRSLLKPTHPFFSWLCIREKGANYICELESHHKQFG